MVHPLFKKSVDCLLKYSIFKSPTWKWRRKKTLWPWWSPYQRQYIDLTLKCSVTLMNFLIYRKNEPDEIKGKTNGKLIWKMYFGLFNVVSRRWLLKTEKCLYNSIRLFSLTTIFHSSLRYLNICGVDLSSVLVRFNVCLKMNKL